MAKTTLSQKVTYHLDLSEEEAMWLKGYIQNAVTGDENFQDAEMRKAIFMALKEPQHLPKAKG